LERSREARGHLGLELLLLLLALGGGAPQLLGRELQVEDLIKQLVVLALAHPAEHGDHWRVMPRVPGVVG